MAKQTYCAELDCPTCFRFLVETVSLFIEIGLFIPWTFQYKLQALQTEIV